MPNIISTTVYHTGAIKKRHDYHALVSGTDLALVSSSLGIVQGKCARVWEHVCLRLCLCMHVLRH